MVLFDWNTLGQDSFQIAEKIRKALPESAFLLFMTVHDADDMKEVLEFGYTKNL